MENTNIFNDYDGGLSIEDQEWIRENAPLFCEKNTEFKNTTNTTKKTNENENINLNRNINGTCKQQVNLISTDDKLQAINKLKQCNYRTSRREIASLLEIIFSKNESKEGHWLWIAQHYNPRTINSVIALMIKQHQTGEKTIDNPSAYFTYLIKFRKQRRDLVSNGVTKGKRRTN